MTERDIKEYAALYSYVILDNMRLTISVLTKNEIFWDLSKDDWYTVMQEFLFYNMNVCGRFTFSWFGVETGEVIMDKMFAEIGSTIDENREKFLDAKLDSLTMQNFSDYLTTLGNAQHSDQLRNLYNQRAAEYSKYDLIREDNSKGFAGLLSWEFAEKVAALLNRPHNDAPFLMSIYTVGAHLSLNIVKTREIWDGRKR